MYVKRLTIRNVRSISHLEWNLAAAVPGWNVVIGNNGSGKSAFVRSVALALVGPAEAKALRQDWNEWLKTGSSSGGIIIHVDQDKLYDKATSRGRTVDHFYVRGRLLFNRDKEQSKQVTLKAGAPTAVDADRYFWGSRKGWFCASYGPFRRFSGGDKDVEKLFYSNPKLARHLSVFGESIALTETLQWLRDLQFQKLEGDDDSAALLQCIKRFVNQNDFLPNGTMIDEVSSSGVSFIDGNGVIVDVEQLSDGYRSVLSMSFELIRQLTLTYGNDIFEDGNDDIIFVNKPGVIIVDEIDAHLHPSWQKKIGFWLTQCFPLIQFIVTTHSALVCQAAINGTIFRLPAPGHQEAGRFLEGDERNRLLYGDILDAYGTEAFGPGLTRSDVSRKMRKRLGELNVKSVRNGLTVAETAERETLRATLPSTASEIPDGKLG